MAVVYLCPTGTYVSVLAANLHLRKIKVNCDVREIIKLPFFLDKNINYGSFLYVGKDETGEKIFTLGTRMEAELIKRSAESLKTIEDVRNIRLINVSPYALKGILLFRFLLNNNQFKLFTAFLLKKQIVKIYEDVKGVWQEL